MGPRLSFVTLGVADLKRVTEFWQGLAFAAVQNAAYDSLFRT